MGNQLATCCGLCPRGDNDGDGDTTGGDSSYGGADSSGGSGHYGHYGESGGQGVYDDGVFGDDTAPLIR